MRKLRVFDTTAEAYVFVWQEFATIVRLSWFPLLFAAIANYLAMEPMAVIAAGLLTVATWVVVAVALHRLILFGDRAPGSWLNLRFGKIEAMFTVLPVLYIVAIVVLSWLEVPLTWSWNGGPAVVAMGVFAIVLFFVARFSLIFPIMVVDRRADFRQAWTLSRGNAWRMIGLWMVVTTPPAAAIGFVQWLLLAVVNVTPAAMTAGQFDGSLLRHAVIHYPASIVLWALCVGTSSYAYKALCGLPGDFVLKPKG